MVTSMLEKTTHIHSQTSVLLDAGKRTVPYPVRRETAHEQTYTPYGHGPKALRRTQEHYAIHRRL